MNRDAAYNLIHGVVSNYANNLSSVDREQLRELAEKYAKREPWFRCISCQTPLHGSLRLCWYCGELRQR